MKFKFYLFLSFLLFVSTLFADTTGAQTLNKGDIAIVGLATSTTADEFSWVPLVDLTAGTKIYFTDAGYDSSLGQFVAFNGAQEGLYRYTVPTGGITAGTLFTFSEAAIPPNYQVVKNTNFGNDDLLTLTNSGDGITVFQSTDSESSGAAFGTTNITLLYMATLSSLDWAATMPTDANNIKATNLHPQLAHVAGSPDCFRALGLADGPIEESDNARYQGITSGSRLDILNALAQLGNWKRYDPLSLDGTGTAIASGSILTPAGWTKNNVASYSITGGVAPSVLLATSPTLTFTGNTGLNSLATDGTGGATAITDLDLQIFAGDKTTGIYTASTIMRWENAGYFSSPNGFNGITPGPDPDINTGGFSALIIKSSNQAANFSLKSIQLEDWGAVGPIRIAGYNNGTLLNFVEVTLPSDGNAVTKDQLGDLLPAYFNDIDEVRIYSNSSAIWIAVNDIKVGAPVAAPVNAPVITNQPGNQSVCIGGNATFSVTANYATGYQWQVNTGSGFVNISNGAPYAGATTATLTITGATSSLNSYSYQCVVTGAATPVATSSAVTLTVKPSPSVVATPSSQAICSGSATSIALTTNLPGTTFAWTAATASGTVNGATASSGTSIVQTLSGNGTVNYTITPTLNGCTGIPITVVITVNPNPVAIATPTSATISSGNSTHITLTSTPTGATFAWTAATISGTVNGASASSGTSIAQMLTGNGVVNYTVTPTLNGCAGAPITVAVTVTTPNTLVTNIAATSANPTNANTVNFTVTFAADVTGVDASDFTLSTVSGTVNGTIGTPTGSGKIWTVPVSSIIGSGTFRLDFTAPTGVNPNVGSTFLTGDIYTIDQTAPQVTSVGVPANKTYKIGQELDFVVNFDENVTVNTTNGTPFIGINLATGGTVQAAYVAGSGSTGLTFRYTVANGNLDADGIILTGAIAANNGTLKDLLGNNVALTLRNIASTNAVRVDGVIPALSTVTIASNNLNATLAKVGNQVAIHFIASETIGLPIVTVGANAATVTGTGANYMATYTMTNSDTEGPVTFNIAFTDVAGNAGVSVTTTTNSSNVTFDRTAPVVPVGLTATGGNVQNQLVWNANGEGDLVNYKLYGGTSANPTTLIQSIIAPTRTYTHTGLTNGTTYYYRITAVDKAGNESAVSADAIAVPKAVQTINFNVIAAKTYGDNGFTLGSATSSTGLAVTYVATDPNVVAITNNTAVILKAGTTTITASQLGDANNGPAANVVQTLTVNQASLIITATGPTKQYGTSLVAGSSSINFITGTTKNGEIVNSVTLTPNLAGLSASTTAGNHYLITPSAAIGTNGFLASNYNISYVDYDGIVGKLNQTITFNPLSNKVYGDVAFALTATGGASGNAVTYTSSNTAVATVAGSTVTIVGAGTATITASQAGNINYTAAADVDQILTVDKHAQTISFAALANKTFGDAPFALTATGGASGNAVTYTSSNTAVATVTGSTITIVGAGTATITASQAGNVNYTASADVDQILTVDKHTQAISFAALANKTFGAAPFALTATGGASGNAVTYASSNTVVATIVGNTVTIVGVGTATITASQLGNANYIASADVDQILTVDKHTQAISFAALANKTFGDVAFALTATGGASGNAVTYTSSNTAVATIAGSTVTIVGAGTTTITASQLGNANYIAAADVDQILTVDKHTQAISFAALANKTFGAAPFALTATGGTSGNAITYTSSNTAVATVTGSTVTIVGAGTATITASQLGNANYTTAADVDQILTVGKQGQTISFATLANKTFGDAPFALTATGGTSGNAIAYTSSNTAVATVTGSTVTIIGAGTTTITASQTGNTNYLAAADVTQDLTINKATAAISLTDLLYTYNGTPRVATATTTPANLIGISITYNGNVTAPTAAGTYAVVASLTNANYVATNATENLVIDKQGQTISFATLANKTFGDAPFALTATGGTSGNAVTYTSSNTAVATVVGSTVTIVGAGTTTITASQTGNANYLAAADVTQDLTINKATAAISLTDLSYTYNGTPRAATATTTPANLTGISITYNGNVIAPTAAGTYAVVASLTNANYIATNATENLIINKQDQTISFAPLANKTFGDAPFALTATGGTSGNAITYTSSNTAVATITGSTVTIVGAGTATITASQTGNANYTAAADVDQILTVGKHTQIISFAALANKTFGDAPFALTATGGTSGNAITYTSSNTAVATVAGSTVTIVGAGTATITASQTGNANYTAAADVDQILTVGKQGQTIGFAALANKTFGDAPFALTASGGTSGNAITYTSSNTAVAAVAGSTVTIIGAGTTTITASQTGNANYLSAADVMQDLTINKATAAISLTDLLYAYNGTPRAATATTTPVGLTGVAITYNGSITAPTAAGTYAVVASLTNANYTATNATGNLVIDKQGQTIGFAALANKTFGDAPFALTASGGTSGNAITYTSSNTAVATVAGSTVTIIGAGTTTITASQTGNANYLAAADVTQDLTINKATAAISLTDLLYTYNGTPRAATATTTPVNLTGISITYNGSITAPTAAGTYAVVASLTNANYVATNATGNLVIDKQGQTISFAALANKTFGDAPFALTATGGTSGNGITYTSSNTAVATVAGSTVTIISAGTTTITASQTGNTNYLAATDVTQDLTINKATATISLTNLLYTYNGTPRAATATTTPVGLTGVAITYNGSATAPTAAGTYAVVASLTNANYAATNATGSLVIDKQGQIISFAALADKLSTDAPFTLTATASSGLVVSYTSSDVSIARITNGNRIEILKAGTVTITANQSGDTNYLVAVSVVQTLRIIDNPAPILVINSSKGNSISKGETTILTATGAITYQWSNANGIISGQNTASLTVRPSVTTTYTVTGSNQYGRSSTQTFTLEVRPDFQAVNATNIVSPNGDGVNDYWIVKNIDLYPDNVVTIFDRAGRTLLKVKGYKNNWDATLNGYPLAEGTYYYVIDFGKGFGSKKGFITIVKE